MGIYSAINVVLVGIGVFHPGWLGMWCVFLTSFFMSLMFPTIFALGIKGLGPNTKLGGSLIVMSIVGGALIPLLMGRIADKLQGIAPAYSIPLIAYVFIAFYAFFGAARTAEP
jgi:FHS family L-fucose permease-like MFS transporter